MLDIADRYRLEGGVRLIEISLTTVEQLFNSLDPSPFHEKDIDDDAEDYIIGAVREFHIGTPLKLVFYLPDSEMAAGRVMDLAKSIHGYFSYRAEAARRDLRFLLRHGRLTLIIGLAFLAVCLAIRALVFVPSEGTVDIIAAEGLVIIGWVAMWRPVEVFLYEWWPLRRRVRVLDKLTAIPVEVRPIDASQAAAPGGSPRSGV